VSLPFERLDGAGGGHRTPLAARMRPRTLDEVLGQDHLVGPTGALRRQVEQGHLASLILWGPPGTGKTTLAGLLAEAVGARLVRLSAVLSGVADVRAAIGAARERRGAREGATVLFIDEIHRFNKGQQDALLPQVEDGTVTLIGATTENPYYEVNAALLSRARVFRLESLSEEALESIVRRAMADPRGLDGRARLSEEAMAHLLAISGGDARAALSVLEAAVALAAAEPAGPEGIVSPTLAMVEDAAQQRTLTYDRAGDGHYDTVSAFIKSMRGNDPDAALYWLATMIAAGEDPRFICRRIIIAASEDVGNADPRALQVAVAAAQALDYVGLPEAQFALAQATVHVAIAPKSNRTGKAYAAAMADVLEHGSLPVPPHLRGASARQRRETGDGKGYRYPHDLEGADVEQQYLPDRLVGRRYYHPSDLGLERRIGEVMEERRAQRALGPSRRSAEVPGDLMAGIGDGMRAHTQNRKRSAEQRGRDPGRSAG
jgi:putative ATPase